MVLKLDFSVKYLGYNSLASLHEYEMRGRLFDDQTNEGLADQPIEIYHRRAPPGTPLPSDWTKEIPTVTQTDGIYIITLGLSPDLLDWLNLSIAYHPVSNLWSAAVPYIIGQAVEPGQNGDPWSKLKELWGKMSTTQKVLLIFGSVSFGTVSVYAATRKRR